MKCKNTIATAAIILVSVFTLWGCGGEETSNQSEPPPAPALAVNDGFVSQTPDVSSYVDLSPYIVSGSQSIPQVIDVVQLNPVEGCGDSFLEENESKLGFVVAVNGNAMCKYEYTVQDKQYPTTNTQQAIVTVVGTTATTPSLIPIPVAIELGNESPTVINLEEELANVGDEYPEGYGLSQNYSLLGDGLVTIDSVNSNVIYTAVNDGPHRIVYQLIDLSGTEHLFGSIDIAVSDGLNEPPIADDHAVSDRDFQLGTTYTIDITPYVISPDGDDFQLVYVNAFNAIVLPWDQSDVTNKMFIFEPLVSGEHYISFTVSDHNGGFDSGMLKVVVSDAQQYAKWTHIQDRSKFYTAPLTLTEAQEGNVAYTGSNNDYGYTPPIQIATFSFGAAKNYCLTMGRLPTTQELQALYLLDASGVHNWPVGLGYWAEDYGVGNVIDVSSGEASLPSGQGNYVTCLLNSTLSVESLQSGAVADGADENGLTVKLSVDELGLADQIVTADVLSGDATLSSPIQMTDEQGNATFTFTSFVAGNVILKVTFQDEKVINGYTFVADEETGMIQPLTVIKNNAVADGSDFNIVQAELLDANSNPIPNKLISFDVSGSAILTPVTGSISYTDLEGKVTVTITDTVEESVGVIATYSTTLSTKGTVVDFVAQPNPTENWIPALSAQEAYLLGFPAEHTYPGYGAYDPAGMDVTQYTYDTAVSYCAGVIYGGYYDWRLPTQEELDRLYDSEGNMFDAHEWPVGFAYWAQSEGSTKYTVNLLTGASAPGTAYLHYNTACIRGGIIK